MAEQLLLVFEEWRDIPGWPHQVSNLGRVRRTAPGNGTFAGRILAGADKGKGYRNVLLCASSRRVFRMVHQLVCEAFHGPRPSPLHEVAHNDGNPSNNRADNLRWDTRAGNQRDKLLHGTHARGEKSVKAKLTEADVHEIRRLRADGLSLWTIARRFNINGETVRQIEHRTRWGWLP